MKLIALSQGKFAKVDDWHYERLSLFSWSAVQKRIGGTFYAVAYTGGGKKNPKRAYMHHLVLPPTPGFTIDHIDGDGLNNQEDNLRYATTSQQAFNSKKRKDNTSGHRGVSRHRSTNKWQAYISSGGVTFPLGLFESLEEAVAARKRAEAELHGEFARDNLKN